MDATTRAAFRSPETQRIDAFVDSAFAFAVSLLIIAGAEPLRSFQDLTTALGRIPAFGFGFGLIVLFWLAHRTWSALTPVRDGWTTFLSLAVVFAILVFVFPLRLLIETATHYLSGGVLPGGNLLSSFSDLRWMYVIYGAAFMVLAGLNVLLFAQARGALDEVDGLARLKAGQWTRTWVIAAGAGLASIGAALSPWLETMPWLPGAAYNLIPAGIGIVLGLDRRRAGRALKAQG